MKKDRGVISNFMHDSLKRFLFIFVIALVILIVVLISQHFLLTGKAISVQGNGQVSLFASGSGNSSDPFVITNCTQLQNIQNNLTANYVLGNDIDCTDTRNWNGGAGFVPIGNISSQFNGTLEGNYYIIKNLYRNISWSGWGGLFGYSSGNISNLGLINLYISAKNLGGLALFQSGGIINNVYVTGFLSGDGSVGGLVGYSHGNILNSYSEVNLSSIIGGGSYALGGLVGVQVEGLIKNSHTLGNINGAGGEGGLVGEQQGGIIDNSYSTINVSGYGGGACGGIVGNQYGGLINNSYSLGNVYGPNIAGGLVGYSGGGIISNSFVNNTSTTVNN